MTSQTNSMRACLFCIVNIHTADCYFCHLHAFLNKQKSHHYLHHGPSVRYSSILKTKKKKQKRNSCSQATSSSETFFGQLFITIIIITNGTKAHLVLHLIYRFY